MSAGHTNWVARSSETWFQNHFIGLYELTHRPTRCLVCANLIITSSSCQSIYAPVTHFISRRYTVRIQPLVAMLFISGREQRRTSMQVSDVSDVWHRLVS